MAWKGRRRTSLNAVSIWDVCIHYFVRVTGIHILSYMRETTCVMASLVGGLSDNALIQLVGANAPPSKELPSSHLGLCVIEF